MTNNPFAILFSEFHQPDCAGTYWFSWSRTELNMKPAVLCTREGRPVNSNLSPSVSAESAGGGHSLNLESAPPSHLKAFSLMILQR